MELRVLWGQSHYPPFKDGLLGTSKLISFPRKNEYKVLRTELGLFRGKAAEFNNVALHCISTLFSGDIWDAAEVVPLQLTHCLEVPAKFRWLRTLYDVGMYPSSTEHR